MNWEFGNTTESARNRLQRRIDFYRRVKFGEIQCLKFALAVIDSLDGKDRKAHWPSRKRVFGRGHKVCVGSLITRYGCFELLPGYTDYAEPGDLLVVGEGDASAHVYLVGAYPGDAWHWNGEAIVPVDLSEAAANVRFVARHKAKGEW